MLLINKIEFIFIMEYFRFIHNYYQLNKILLFAVALFVLVSLFPRQTKFKYEYTKGKPWQHEELIAPFDFSIIKSKDEFEADKSEALGQILPFFRVDVQAFKNATDEFDAKLEKKWLSKYPSASISSREFLSLKYSGDRILDSLYNKGIVEDWPSQEARNAENLITLVNANVATSVTYSEFLTISSANDYIVNACQKLNHADASMLISILQETLSFNVKYDNAFTDSQRRIAVESVSPTRGMLQKGERIIGKGEIIDDEKYRTLNSFSTEYEKMHSLLSDYGMILLGRIILMALALAVFALFMITFRHDIFIQNRNLVLLLSLIVMMTSLTALVIKKDVTYLNAVPLALVPIIVRTFYDTRLALFVHIITIVILGFLVPNSFEFLFLQLITGIITIISVVNLQKRSQFFFTSLMIFFSYSIIYIGVNLMQEGSLKEIDTYSFFLFAVSALLTLFSYPLIFIFEKLFGLVTDVSLLEYSDTNSKLLREMAMIAPGSFQHSLVVASIAEDAARAVTANPLLARAGALYHDIGKMEMPLYFIENYTGDINPHAELSTEESAQLITSHVINGVEMAKKYNLPEKLIDFIRTHHGTRLTQFFYNKFMSEHPDETMNENLFRYRGPVPFSKETSIVMMADSVEAASRVMKTPTEEKIDALVERIINDQMANKQFDNSELTIKDITTIKKIIKKKLLSIYHIRIEYPVDIQRS